MTGEPDMVIAFTGGRRTADMTSASARNGQS